MESIWCTDHPQSLILPAGTVLTWTRIWTRRKIDEKQTPMIDVEITVQEDTVITEAITMLEKKSLTELERLGGYYLREYYVEDLAGLGTSKVEILFGT